jgi:tRNA pseudouridine13 synthase
MAAFQSYLWNRWLSAIIDHSFPSTCVAKIASKCGPLSVPTQQIFDQQSATSLSDHNSLCHAIDFKLPLPAARQHQWPETLRPYLDAILTELEMDVHQLRVKYPRDTFFSKGDRNVWLAVHDLDFEFTEDPENPSSLLQISFELPRGAYATMVVKFLSDQSHWHEVQSDLANNDEQ